LIEFKSKSLKNYQNLKKYSLQNNSLLKRK